MTITAKTYNELSKDELYDLLQLRSEVFVVEQDCVYQDIDGKDQKAVHVLGYSEGQLKAYTRVFGAGDYFDYPSIGRVVVKDDSRQLGYGKEIMTASMQVVMEHFETETMELSAQTYLKSFYNDLGFKEIGEEYLEDGIPHIRMRTD